MNRLLHHKGQLCSYHWEQPEQNFMNVDHGYPMQCNMLGYELGSYPGQGRQVSGVLAVV